MNEILVAYASKHGSTREVAEVVAEELGATLRPAGDVRELSGYGAVVLGAPLYMGRWHKDARKFLHRHSAALAALPFAIFALGPLKDEPEQWGSARTQLEHALEAEPGLAPVSVELFGGALDPEAVPFPFSRMPGGDLRDWDAIRAWARALELLVPVA